MWRNQGSKDPVEEARAVGIMIAVVMHAQIPMIASKTLGNSEFV